jgi:hypothetical protein
MMKWAIPTTLLVVALMIIKFVISRDSALDQK